MLCQMMYFPGCPVLFYLVVEGMQERKKEQESSLEASLLLLL